MLILFEVREITMLEMIGSMHIVREEHWAANGSHAYMVKVSAGQFNPQISYEILSLLNA